MINLTNCSQASCAAQYAVIDRRQKVCPKTQKPIQKQFIRSTNPSSSVKPVSSVMKAHRQNKTHHWKTWESNKQQKLTKTTKFAD